MLSVSAKVLRCLLWSLLAIYAAAVLACLGLRYWVLPRIDQWRPQIEQQASKALGSRVTIGMIAADWSGLNPRLHLSTVSIHDAGHDDAVVLNLPTVDAVLAWRSVLLLSPRLQSLNIESADLSVRRDDRNQLWVAGLSFDPAASAGGGTPPFLDWLLQQREVSIHRATLRWRDELRQSPELVLSNVDFLMRNGVLSHRLALLAQPPAELAAGLNVRVELDRRLFGQQAPNLTNWSGQIYVQVDDAQPSAWSPWLDLPVQAQGRVGARAWLRMARGQMQDVTLDAMLRNLYWQSSGDHPAVAVSADEAKVHVSGDLAHLLPSLGLESGDGEAFSNGLSVQIDAKGVQTALPQVFESPEMEADELHAETVLSQRRGQPLRVDVGLLRVVNDDLDLTLRGAWRNEGADGAGTADLRGRLARMSMPALHRYLPLEVSQDARDWLRTSLLAGEARNVDFTLKGELADFPYTRPGSTGEFHVAGSYQGASVDYVPARTDRKGWPVLEQLGGGFVIDRASLALDSGGGLARTGPNQSVALENVKALIPNMEHDAELTVEGTGAGSAPAFLAMATNSPLGGLLSGSLDQAEATGDWRVPIKLFVPLMHTDDTRVNGSIIFHGGSFRLMPQVPQMNNLQGGLEFSEQALQVHDLQGVFLGGPARLSGKLGGGGSLNFSGQLAASGLNELSPEPSMRPLWRRFTGRASYQGKLAYGKGGDVEISGQSDLKGLAIDLPAPLGKAASAAMPLSVGWAPATDGGRAGRHWLRAGLGDNINLLLERDLAERGSFFARGALGVGRSVGLPARGMSVAGTFDALDVDAWSEINKQISAPANGSPRAAAPLLPEVEQVGLTTGRLVVSGQTFDQVELLAQRPAPAQWRVTIDSKQAAGTLEWMQASNAAAGKVTARLTRLALGSADDSGKSEAASPSSDSENDLSDIPAVDLQAQQFTMYGRDLGRLNVQGTNLERGNLWRLDKLQVSNEAATLDATGSWRLSGADRGLTVDLNINFLNLGQFLERLGYTVVSDGRGTMQGQLTWRNLPWRHDPVDIDGELHVDLERGRFLHLNSRAARLLELLSLQSVTRLATFNFNPAGLLKDGFPFDTVQGTMKLAHGVLSTEGYKVSGPAAAIMLDGSTNIVTEQWDLRAVVIPTLDASGAAVAAAFVNPLVGLGTFLTQWLLREPLGRAMSVEYRVHGTWDDPQVEVVQNRAAGNGAAGNGATGNGARLNNGLPPVSN